MVRIPIPPTPPIPSTISAPNLSAPISPRVHSPPSLRTERARDTTGRGGGPGGVGVALHQAGQSKPWGESLPLGGGAGCSVMIADANGSGPARDHRAPGRTVLTAASRLIAGGGCLPKIPDQRGGTRCPYLRRTTGWTSGPASHRSLPMGREHRDETGSPAGGPGCSLACP